MGNAALHHFFVQRQHEGAALDFEEELDRLQHLDGLVGQAAIEVVNEEDEVDLQLRLQRRLARQQPLQGAARGCSNAATGPGHAA